MSAVANYIPGNSVFHKLNPLTKLLWSVSLMTLSFFFKSPMVLLFLLGTIIIVTLLAGIFKQLFPVFKGLFIFAGVFLLFQIFFIEEGRVILDLVPGTKWLKITDIGLGISLALGCRLMVVAASFPVLLATTQVKDLVIVLVEKIKIPYTYAFMFITSLRFVPTFMSEMEQIIQAQCSRGHRLDERNFIRKFLSLCPLAIPLMISSIKKAEQLAISMETRGFGNGQRTYLHEINFQRVDWLVCTGLVFLVALGIMMNLKGILI